MALGDESKIFSYGDLHLGNRDSDVPGGTSTSASRQTEQLRIQSWHLSTPFRGAVSALMIRPAQTYCLVFKRSSRITKKIFEEGGF